MSIRFRRGTNSQWEANKSNIIAGEPAIVTDKGGRFFVGLRPGQSAEFLRFREAPSVLPNTSTSLTVPNFFNGVLFAFCPSSAMGMYMINCSSSGTVNVANVLEASNVTVTASSNTVNVSNNSSADLSLYYIGNDIFNA